MKKLFAVLLFATAAAPAYAYLDYTPLMSVGTWNNNANVYIDEWQKHIRKGGAAAPAAQRSTVIEVRAAGPTASKLAAAYPAAQRAEAQRVFDVLLAQFAQVEQHFGLPHHDYASAVATFITGSFEAYHDISIEPSHFKALVSQMQQLIGSNAAFAKASNAEKQDSYEQLAIIGMFMAGVQSELQRSPNPRLAANMKQAAKGNLEQFLKTDADRIGISARGLEIR